MDISLPKDCGNAPRIGIVSQFAVSWASGDSTAIHNWLAEDATVSSAGCSKEPATSAEELLKLPFSPERMELLSVITHGRLASCDGFVLTGIKRLDFSLVFRFSSTSKTAKIAELRVYGIESESTQRT